MSIDFRYILHYFGVGPNPSLTSIVTVLCHGGLLKQN